MSAAKGLEQAEAARGNATNGGCDERVPPGTTAALGVLRRELKALEEDYDKMRDEFEQTEREYVEMIIENQRLRSRIDAFPGDQ